MKRSAGLNIDQAVNECAGIIAAVLFSIDWSKD